MPRIIVAAAHLREGDVLVAFPLAEDPNDDSRTPHSGQRVNHLEPRDEAEDTHVFVDLFRSDSALDDYVSYTTWRNGSLITVDRP